MFIGSKKTKEPEQENKQLLKLFIFEENETKS